MFARLQSILLAALVISAAAAPTPGHHGSGSGSSSTSSYTNYGGIGGSYNGAGDVIQNGDNFGNSFKDVGAVNGGFVQGSSNFNIGNNGAFSGNTYGTSHHKRGEHGSSGSGSHGSSSGSHGSSGSSTNYGGIGGSYNGAGDHIQNGDNFSNSFDHVGAVNGGFAQGSGNFDITNNGAYSGNTCSSGHHKRGHGSSSGSSGSHGSSSVNYGGYGGSYNGAFDQIQNGDNFANSFKNVGQVNGGFAQGSGNFKITNNGAFSGNKGSC